MRVRTSTTVRTSHKTLHPWKLVSHMLHIFIKVEWNLFFCCWSHQTLTVLKIVHPDLGISRSAMKIIENFMNDILVRLGTEACRLARYNKTTTLSSKEIQAAAVNILPGKDIYLYLYISISIFHRANKCCEIRNEFNQFDQPLICCYRFV